MDILRKKIFGMGLLFLGGILCISSTMAETLEPQLEISLSPQNPATQRVYVGDEGIEVFRFLLTSRNQEAGSVTLNNLKIEHTGNPTDFLRYNLVQDNRVISIVSLVRTPFVEFKNMNLVLENGKTEELKVFVDIAHHELSGEHQFFISHPDLISVPKNDIRDKETRVIGKFPIEANRVIIGHSFDRPASECNLREEPVCGEDGKTYYNLCIPFQKEIKIAYEGICYGESLVLEKCSDEEALICGDNGKTYKNQCFLEREENVFKQYNGMCFPKDFTLPKTFKGSVELLELKINKLNALRPRISTDSEMRLSEVLFVLKSYNFTAKNIEKIIPRIGNFLQFSENSSKRLALEQEIELLSSFVVSARSDSAREKYESGMIPFRDVDENAWFLGAVQFMKNNNFVHNFVSTDDLYIGVFRPDEFITKAQTTQALFSLLGIDVFSSPPARNSFARNHEYYNAIAAGESLGLTLWKNEPNPNQKINRVEMLRLLLEIFEEKVPTYTVSSFRDVTDKNEVSIIEYARHKGLISGYSDGSFRPRRLLTRAEAVQIIWKGMRIFGKQ